MLFQHACRKTLRGRHLGRHVGATCLPQCARITAGILAGTLFLQLELSFRPFRFSVAFVSVNSSKSLGKGILAEAGKATRLRLGPAPGSILAILDLDLGKAPGLYLPWPFWASILAKRALAAALPGPGWRGGARIPPGPSKNPLRSLGCPCLCACMQAGAVSLHACIHTYIHPCIHTYIQTDMGPPSQILWQILDKFLIFKVLWQIQI